jgi:hypothetical protein
MEAKRRQIFDDTATLEEENETGHDRNNHISFDFKHKDSSGEA